MYIRREGGERKKKDEKKSSCSTNFFLFEREGSAGEKMNDLASGDEKKKMQSVRAAVQRGRKRKNRWIGLLLRREKREKKTVRNRPAGPGKKVSASKKKEEKGLRFNPAIQAIHGTIEKKGEGRAYAFCT